MRLIDADALIERLDDFNKWCKDERLKGSLFAADVVGDMPTVCDIDAIRQEIENVFCISVITNELRTPMEVKAEIWQIIDKYTK